MNANRREKGQVLVLIVLAIVGLLGFVALAVDIGRVFAERRRAQNAADSAVMAAANAGASETDEAAREGIAQAAGIKQLGLNDYLDPNTINDNLDAPVEIEIHYPPVSGVYQGNNEYYQVIIHEHVDKVFSQFIFPGLLQFTVEAVANTATAQGMFEGNALVATSPDSCKALWFSGTADTQIHGGDAYSLSGAGNTADNSCTAGVVQGGGGASCASGVRDGAGEIYVDSGHTVNTHGPWRDQGSGGVFDSESGDPVSVNQCQPVLPIETLPTPICGPTQTVPPPDENNVIELYPGTYPDGIKIVNAGGDPLDPLHPPKRVHLNHNNVGSPGNGLYCLGQDITMLGGEITGFEVMFYMASGSFNLGGGTIVNLQSATDLKGAIDANGNTLPDFQWGGMLIYMPPENLGEVHIGGGGFSRYSGTIFAPGPRSTEGQDKCVIEGTGESIGLNSSVICYTIKITGDAAVNIFYNSDTNFHNPPSFSLSQ